MIYVKLPSTGKEIGVRFEHHCLRRPNSIWAEKPNPKYGGPASRAADLRKTICQILDPSVRPAGPITTAEVTWNPLDRFSKLDGQKKALTKALNYLTGLGVCTAEDRGAIWEAFWAARDPKSGVAHIQAEITPPEATESLLGAS